MSARRLTRDLLLCLALAVPACAAAQEQLLPSPLPPAGPRLRVFISDTHIGLGRVLRNKSTGRHTEGPWHPTEDFRWAADLRAFMAMVRAEAARLKVSTDLIIAGDFLELWQSPIKICTLEPCSDAERAGKLRRDCEYAENEDLGCTLEEALARARRVLGAHAETLALLRDFANAGDNRVVIIPGNHDAALVFDAVAGLAVREIGAAPGRVRVATEGYWLSADGLLFAEHGHQIEGDPNKFEALPASCLDRSGRRVACNGGGQRFLQRPWGENFVQKYYEQYEARFPILDNISDRNEGIVLGIFAAGIGDSLAAVRDGFKFLLFQQSVSQALQGLGPEGPIPQYDFKAIRETGDAFLVDSVPPTEERAALRAEAARALAQGSLKVSVKALSDEEIQTLCDVRESARAAQLKAGAVPTIAQCPQVGPPKLGADVPGSLGGVAVDLFTTERKRFQRRFRDLRDALQQSGRPTADFQVYIYGHTHQAHTARQPFGNSPGWSPLMLNSGAWQRLATRDQLAEIRNKRGIETWQTLLALGPEDLPACYSFIFVQPYAEGQRGDIKPELLWWVRTGGGWRVLEGCSP